MKARILTTVTAAALVLITAPARAAAATWDIDPSHSAAQFSVSHLTISTVRGELGKVTGTLTFDGQDVAGLKVDATVDVTGIDTREPKRDEHLRSPDFFDVAKYPTLTFKSKRSEKAGAGKFKLVGDLTLRGVTKEVTLDVEGPAPELKDPWGNVRIGATATTKINRKDFGLNWNAALESGGWVVGDEVSITLDVEAIKKKEEAAAK
jgi:polyisoprenoid-binding protein YceI